jgi:type III restriction enzyme
MSPSPDRQRFRNEDLILKVAPHVSRSVWDENKYEAFLDALCADRPYQKEALLTSLRYLLGGRYENLHALAEENFDNNVPLQDRYGTLNSMERHLQLPEKLSASIDLATATGKSYVLYGLAIIMLAEGAVDRVLVLCPSTTIEAGLLEKFRDLAGNTELRDLLPADAQIGTPHIINATQTIVEGSICVENYHAILEHVGSSVRDSLRGKGPRTLILNDEAHHVANESTTQVKRWKEFLLDPSYAFRYIIGTSGTCYIGDEYFADVIFRYSLRQAMEERYVKLVDYVAEMPRTQDPDEKWQVVRNRHEATKKQLRPKRVLPLTIIVTPTVAKARDVAEELKAFLVEHDTLTHDQADERVLEIYSNSKDVPRLAAVDDAASKVEWVVSVSMLTEGWDVKRVFQIVPHEERAFNSKLLISQVLGRGLRIPNGWTTQPQVTVFNHDAWAPRIRHLVNEVLEREKHITSKVVTDSSLHFQVDNIEYDLQTISEIKKPMSGEYDLFAKGYVDLPTTVAEEDVEVQFERAGSGARYAWQTRITHKTYTTRQVAQDMYSRLRDAEDPDDPSAWPPGTYTTKYNVARLEKVVSASLKRVGMTAATESAKQKLLQALGPLRRRVSETVRYRPVANQKITTRTADRRSESVNASDLHNEKTLFFTPDTRATLDDEQLEFFDEIAEPGSGYRAVPISNPLDFKTPLNCVIADHDPERKFIAALLSGTNRSHYDAWLKSVPTRFYEIDYAWKKGEHPKRGKFSPDFFVKAGHTIIVVEIKGDEELRETNEENRKKAEYAIAHFERLNTMLKAEGRSTRYLFKFLTPKSFNAFFSSLRSGKIAEYRSDLDVKLAENGI